MGIGRWMDRWLVRLCQQPNPPFAVLPLPAVGRTDGSICTKICCARDAAPLLEPAFVSASKAVLVF